MKKINLLNILVNQLCDIEKHKSDLAKDALCDFISSTDTLLHDKQKALSLIEKKIMEIAEEIGFFERKDIPLMMSDEDENALYSLLVARRYMMDKIMGEPSKNLVALVSRQSKKLAILTEKCLRQGTEMWDAIKATSRFESKDGYLQYGEFVLTYQADSCHSVLALDDDNMYGSDFNFIHRLVCVLCEQINLFDDNLIDKKLILDALAGKDWADEDLPSGVARWYESALLSPAFEGISINPALLILHCSLPYSIPDIVRMNHFVCSMGITCEKDISLDTYNAKGGMSEIKFSAHG